MHNNSNNSNSRRRAPQRVAAVLLLLLIGAGAQGQRTVLENTFFSLSGGVNSYVNDAYGPTDNPGAHFEASVGYHLNNNLAFRLSATAMQNTGASGADMRYLYGHADLVWNMTNTFLGYNANRRGAFGGVYGFGLAHGGGDNDFCLLAGLRGQVRATDRLCLYAEVRTMLHPNGFDGNEALSLAPTITLGGSVTINENAYYNTDKPGCPKTATDWYFGFGLVGLNSFQYTGLDNRLEQLQPAAQLCLGKAVTPCWSGRLCFGGGQAEYSDWIQEEMKPDPIRIQGQFRYLNLHGDLMLNIVQAIAQGRNMPRFTLHPYAGAGVLLRADHLDECHMALEGGLMARLIVGQRSDLFVDLQYALTEPTFAHLEGYHVSRFGVGLASVNAGYILNLGQGRYRRLR